MANKRELIVKDVIDTLKSADNPMFGLVTRDNFEPAQLSRQQFPAIYIATANETRADLTQGGTSGTREGLLEITFVVWVNGSNIDTQRNDVIERIEEAIDVDRTRDGNAMWTQVRDITVDFEIVEPFGKVEITTEIYYTYTRGAL